jgi:hypothetical protein
MDRSQLGKEDPHGIDAQEGPENGRGQTAGKDSAQKGEARGRDAGGGQSGPDGPAQTRGQTRNDDGEERRHRRLLTCILKWGRHRRGDAAILRRH